MKLGKRFTPCFPFDKNPVQVCGILFSEGVISHKTANSLGRSRRERKWSYGSRTANAGKNTDRDSQRRDRSPLCSADACGDRCKNRRSSAVRAGIGFCRCDIYGQLRYRVDYGQTPDNGGDRRKRDRAGSAAPYPPCHSAVRHGANRTDSDTETVLPRGRFWHRRR